MAKIFIGVDGGKNGAVAILGHGDDPLVFDFEDPAGLVALQEVSCLWARETLAVIELPGVRPGEAGSRGLKFGRSVGRVDGWFQALDIPHDKDVSPAKWTRDMGVQSPGNPKKRKELSLALARRLFPSLAASHLTRKKDDGRAEALLIAEWLRRRNIGQQQ